MLWRIHVSIQEKLSEVVDSAKDLVGKAGEHSPFVPDAIQLLKADHREVEALFKTILSEKSSTLAKQRKNIEAVLAALTLHAKIEESIVYPAVYKKTKRDSDQRLEVLEAVEEHGSMKNLMSKIKNAKGRDESLKAKVQVLSEITEHHVKEEEAEFFPEAKKLLGEKKLREIGVEILKIKKRSAGAKGSPRRSVKRTTTRKKSVKA
jgi:hemerythrin superfamily protein